MNFFVTTILMATMGVHAALGCCLHHPHSCATRCHEESLAANHSCGGAHSHAETSHGCEANCNTSHAPHHPHECEGEHCNVARTDTFPELAFLIAFDVSQLAALIPSVSQINWFASNEPDSAQLSSRIHLAPCVWII